MALDRFRAAPLPMPPSQWDAQYMRQVIRVLENYFSQLDSRAANNAEQYSADRFIGGSFTGEGSGISVPYNEFFSLTDQTVPAIDQAAIVQLENTVFDDGITIGGVNNTQITFSKPGIYMVTYSLSFRNPNNDREFVDVWFRLNDGSGTADIPNSNCRFTIPTRRGTGTAVSYLVASSSYSIVAAAAGSFIEIAWATTSTSVTMEHLAPVAFSAGVTPAIPGTPSALVQVNFVSPAV